MGALSSVDRIVAEFGHTPTDAARWLEQVRYSRVGMPVDVMKMRATLSVLKDVGLVSPQYNVSDLWGGIANRAVALVNDETGLSVDHYEGRQLRYSSTIKCGQDLSGW